MASMELSEGAAPAGDEYVGVKPGRIKLKETKADKAHRLYRREQRRHQRDSLRIARANGLPYTNSRSTACLEDEDDLRDATEEARTRESQDHLKFIHRLQQGPSYSYPFPHAESSTSTSTSGPPPQNIPSRFRAKGSSHGAQGTSVDKGKRRRDAAEEVSLEGGAVPDIGEMEEEEYSTWVRSGMDRLRTRAETSARAAERRENEEKEHRRAAQLEAREKAARKKEKSEAKRMQREIEQQKEKLRMQADELKRMERKRYRDRWKALLDIGGEVEMAQLRLDDIPWPVYRAGIGGGVLERLEAATVGDFLRGLEADEAGDEKERTRKVLREAIRAFHPDRFFGRILPRVREGDRETVKQGVEQCSRVLNELAEKSKLL